MSAGRHPQFLWITLWVSLLNQGSGPDISRDFLVCPKSWRAKVFSNQVLVTKKRLLGLGGRAGQFKVAWVDICLPDGSWEARGVNLE